MKKCCEQHQGTAATPNLEKPELTVRVCKVCGTSHYTVNLEPLTVGVEGKDV